MKKSVLMILALTLATISAIGQNNNHNKGLPFGVGMLNPVAEKDTVKLPFQFFPEAPADSQLAKISFTLKWNPVSGLNYVSILPDTSNTTFKGWTFQTVLKQDGPKQIDVSMIAPANTFYVKDSTSPGKMLDIFLEVAPDGNHEAIHLTAENVIFGMKGVDRTLSVTPIEIGAIFDKDGPAPNPNPGGAMPLFSIDPNLTANPNSRVRIPFDINGNISADSSYIGITLEIFWMPRHLYIPDAVLDTMKTFLKGWSYTYTKTDSSMLIQFDATNGNKFHKEDQMSQFAFALNGDIGNVEQFTGVEFFAKSLLLRKQNSSDQLVQQNPLKLGFISFMTGGGNGGGGGNNAGGNPYGNFVPLLSTNNGRTNNGLYGGSILDFSWDNVNNIMYAASEAASSVYASADSGKSWSSPFPIDSLEWFEGNVSRRGWGGRGVAVVANQGYVYSVTVEQAGTLNSSQVKKPGKQFETLLDEFKAKSVFTNQNLNVRLGFVDAISSHVIVASENTLYRSEDAGLNWSMTYVPSQSKSQDYKIKQVGILEADTKHALVVAETQNATPSSRLFKTTDGLVFTDISPIDTDTLSVDAFALHPTHRDTMIVSTRKKDGKTDGIWKSTNGGTSWTRIKTIDQGTDPLKVLPQLFVYESKGKTLFVIVAGAGDNEVSDDLGSTFQPIMAQNDPQANVVTRNAVGQAHIPNSDIYFGTGDTGPARSVTGLNGVFSPVPDGIEGVNVWKIAQSPNVLDTLYLATSSGIAYTTVYTREDIPNREKWLPPYGKFPINPNNGGNTGFSAIQVYEQNPNLVIAANGNGIFTSSTGGKTNDAWTAVDYNQITGLDGNKMRQDGGRVTEITFLNADTVFASVSLSRSLYGTILVSYNGGTSWSAITSVKTNHSYNAVKKATRGNTTYLYAVTGGTFENNVIDSGAVYRSIDKGLTWNFRGYMPDAQFNPLGFPMPINDFEAVNNSLDTLYFAAGTNLSNVVGVSYDGGVTINAVFGGYEGAFEAVAINKDSPDSVYFAVRRNIFVFDAVNNSTQLLFRGFPGELTYDLLYDALTQGSSGGFFNLKKPTSTSTGIFENELDGIPGRIHLFQNYPNPFNPTTMIEFSLPKMVSVRLDVFNVIGQRVATLVNNELYTSGVHQVQFDASSLASGMYFYRLQSGNTVITNKMMLIK